VTGRWMPSMTTSCSNSSSAVAFANKKYRMNSAHWSTSLSTSCVTNWASVLPAHAGSPLPSNSTAG